MMFLATYELFTDGAEEVVKRFRILFSRLFDFRDLSKFQVLDFQKPNCEANKFARDRRKHHDLCGDPGETGSSGGQKQVNNIYGTFQ